MASLREQQKERRRVAIIKAALELFCKNGYEASTVEQIASRASVSGPTVFKYFGTKQDIVLTLIEDADLRALRDARARMSSHLSAVDTLCLLDRLIIEYELSVIPASVWRELLPLWYGKQPSALVQLNDSLVQQVASVMTNLQLEGKMCVDIDPLYAARFFNEYSTLRFMRLAHDEHPDLDAHSQHSRTLLEMLFRGMHP